MLVISISNLYRFFTDLYNKISWYVSQNNVVQILKQNWLVTYFIISNKYDIIFCWKYDYTWKFQNQVLYFNFQIEISVRVPSFTFFMPTNVTPPALLDILTIHYTPLSHHNAYTPSCINDLYQPFFHLQFSHHHGYYGLSWDPGQNQPPSHPTVYLVNDHLPFNSPPL